MSDTYRLQTSEHFFTEASASPHCGDPSTAWSDDQVLCTVSSVAGNPRPSCINAVYSTFTLTGDQILVSSKSTRTIAKTMAGHTALRDKYTLIPSLDTIHTQVFCSASTLRRLYIFTLSHLHISSFGYFTSTSIRP